MIEDQDQREILNRLRTIEAQIRKKPPDMVLHPPTFPVYLMYVTTAITKRVGITLGSGFAKVATVGAVGTDQLDPGSATPVAVKNFHLDKGFKVNVYIKAFKIGGTYFAFDVDACANLSS